MRQSPGQVSELGDALGKGVQVVEIVGDAAGELADGFHLLRLAQRLLGAPQPLGRLLLVMTAVLKVQLRPSNGPAVAAPGAARAA